MHIFGYVNDSHISNCLIWFDLKKYLESSRLKNKTSKNTSKQKIIQFNNKLVNSTYECFPAAKSKTCKL